MGDVLHPDTCIFKYFRIFYRKLPGHDRYVHCRRIMAVGIRQTTAVLEMGIRHAKLRRLRIHLFHESFFASRYVFRHRHAGIIARSYSDTFDQGL